MNGHHVAHYAIAAVLAVVAGSGYWTATHEPKAVQITHVDPSVGFAEAAPKPIRGAWPGLGQDKTIKLGEALQKLGPAKVTIFCTSERCKVLMSDLDDAFQIAGWDDEEETSVMGDGVGLMVGPPGPKADGFREALGKVVSGPITVVDMRVDTDLGLFIGKMAK